MVSIVSKEDPILRKKAQKVALEEISTPAFQKILSDMKDALASQDDGVAIAAPQIGVSKSIFVVSHKVFAMSNGADTKNTSDHSNTTDSVFINPVIVKISKQTKLLEEGCLSVRYLYGKVRRAHKIRIEAYDEHGKKQSHGASGILAQIFQHEIDHLEGILFIDKAVDVEDLPPSSSQS